MREISIALVMAMATCSPGEEGGTPGEDMAMATCSPGEDSGTPGEDFGKMAVRAVNAYIEKLDSVDFEERELASETLKKVLQHHPGMLAPYVRFLLARALATTTSPEARWRLIEVARKVHRRIIEASEEWRAMTSTPGFEYNIVMAPDGWPQRGHGWEKPDHLVLVVDEIDLFGPADGVLMHFDVIVAVDGQPVTDLFRFDYENGYEHETDVRWALAGRECKLTILRNRDQEKLARNFGNHEDGDKFVEMEVKVIPVPMRHVPEDLRDELEALAEAKWREFVRDFLAMVAKRIDEEDQKE